MARPTKQERLAAIHAEARAAFTAIQEAQRDERLQCLEDRRFYSIAGAQWEGDIGAQFDNRIKLEIDKTHLSVMRVINEYRNNRISVKFRPKDGTNDDELADTCAGLYRADEDRSVADEAYDNAFEEAVGGGFGAWRLRADYEDEEDDEDERQCILIEPIYDADTSVYFDLNAKRQDKSDAKHCYVLTAMTRDAYVAEWDDDPSSWPKDIDTTAFDWATPDTVYVAEYYRVEEVRDVIEVWRDVTGAEERYTQAELDDDEGELRDQLQAVGSVWVREKRVKRQRVRKYIMSGAAILEDCGYVAGSCIPIVPVYGKRWFIDNIERCMGHVRKAKDLSRLKNMQMSLLAEISAHSTVEKPIFAPEQIAGHEVMWAEDTVKNYPYLMVNTIRDDNGQEVATGPLGYTKPPAIPPAMAALLQLVETDLQDVLGRQQEGEEVTPQTSGIAIELIQNRLDMQSYIYMSNMAKAMRRCGEIWLSMAKDVYVEEGRVLRVLDEQGEIDSVTLMQPGMERGVPVMRNDLGQAKFDVAVEVGPSSSSRRASTVRALTGMMQITQDPQDLVVLSGMALMNMEGEGIRQVREYFRKKLVRLGVVEPTDAEAEEMAAEQQNAAPDPNAAYLEAEGQKALAQAAKYEAETLETMADTELARARTVETLAGVDTEQRRTAIETAKAMAEVRRQPPAGNGRD